MKAHSHYKRKGRGQTLFGIAAFTLAIVAVFAIYAAPSHRASASTTSSGWSQLHPGTSPEPRFGAAMAYYPPTGELVLFGGTKPGRYLIEESTYFGDTWTWDGANWTKRHPNPSPPARVGALMTYNAARGVILLCGGAGSEYPGDTWTWDGNGWTQINVPNSPCGDSMTYDAARKTVVLYNSGDTYTWDGGNTMTWNHSFWMRCSPIHGPGSASTVITYDAASESVVLFGGIQKFGDDRGGNYPNGTWRWDGVDWTQLHPAHSPPGRFTNGFTYDSAARVAVLFGGRDNNNGVLGDTWTWDGADWTEQRYGSSPEPRGGASIGYHAATGKVILFGGFNADPAVLNDTWSYRAPATNRPTEPIQAGPGPPCDYQASTASVNSFNKAVPSNAPRSTPGAPPPTGPGSYKNSDDSGSSLQQLSSPVKVEPGDKVSPWVATRVGRPVGRSYAVPALIAIVILGLGGALIKRALSRYLGK